MALDFVVALSYIGIVWCLGQWTVGFLFGEDREKDAYLLAFPLGFSEMTLLSTFLYFTGRFSVQAIRVVWILLGCASLIAVLRRRLVKRTDLMVFIAVLGLWLIMLIPGIAGGDQYYVYRGNCTDQQTYVEETVALSMHPIGWYESRSQEEVEAVSDVLWRGYRWAVKDRPSAGMMIAVMRANPSGEIYWVVYLYRKFVQAMIMASMLYLFRVVLGNRNPGSSVQASIRIAAAALYCAGFWGQIQYDIDAVSQMSSIAVLTALTAVFIQYVLELVEERERVSDKQRLPVMILFAAAGLALYLESALVHGALYLLAGILVLLGTKKKLQWKQVMKLVGIPIISLGILILANYRITSFLVGQINSSVSDVRQSWADYFNRWWLGKYGVDNGRITEPVSRLTNCIISTSGMYNMTVNYERYYGFAALFLTGLAVLLTILILCCILRPLVKRMDRSIWMLWVIVIAGIAIVVGMCIGGKNWSAGKLLYYVSPYLYAFLCLPALRIRDCRGIVEKLALALAIVMLLSNGKMVLERCRDVRVNFAGLGYRGNYPSDMIPGLKMFTNFTLDTHQLEGIDGVVIDDLSMISDHQFFLQYIKVKLTCAEISWTYENDIDYYGDLIEASKYRTLQGNLAMLEAVQDDNDRYEIVIRKSE